jgi:hypothetical protein
MSKATLLHIQLGKLKENLTLLIVVGKYKNGKKEEIQASTFTACFKFRPVLTMRGMQAVC